MYSDIEEIIMNLNKPMTIKHLLAASIATICVSVGSTLSVAANQGFLDDIQDLKIKVIVAENRIIESNINRPTFDEVNELLDERGMVKQFNEQRTEILIDDDYQFSERHPEIDYSEGSNEGYVEPTL